MITSTAFTLAIASLAAASPLTQRNSAPDMSTSKGFRLVINVTDASRDFKDDPVHGQEIGAVHTGAALNAPIPAVRGAVFYETGPVGPEFYNNTLQMGIGGPEAYGLVMDGSADVSGAHGLAIQGGLHGTPGFSITGGPHFQNCPAMVGPGQGTFAVCDLGFGAPSHPKRVLQFIVGSHPSWYTPPSYVPDNCVAVHLLVQCDTLDLSQATYPHDNIWDETCYANISVIKDWTQYGSMISCYN